MSWNSQVKQVGLLLFPFSLCLPIPLIYKSIALVIFCCTLLLSGEYSKLDYDIYLKNKAFQSLILFYILGIIVHLIREGQFYFEEVRLSFIVLPLVFPIASSLLKANFQKIINSFVLGVFIYIIYAASYVIYFYGWHYPEKDFALDYYFKYVLYNYLPGAIHHTYLGIYINFAMVWILFGSRLRPFYKIVLLFTILSTLPFLASKWSILVAILILAIWLSRISGRAAKIILYLGTLFFSTVIIVLANRTDLFRTLSSSISMRTKLFDCTLQGIEENWILGIGKQAIKSWMHSCTQGDLNMDTHNIFVQELLSSGIFALIILIGIFYFLFRYANKQLVFYLFLGLIVLYGLVEHIFNTQLGVTFFCFFTVLFLISSIKNSNSVSSQID